MLTLTLTLTTGKVNDKGKGYEVEDGDMILFKFNT